MNSTFVKIQITAMISLLIVDENPELAEKLESTLSKEVYRIYKAVTTEEALLFIEEIKPSLILIDFLNKGGEGIELCRTLKNTSKGKAPLVVLISYNADETTQVQAFEAGADDFIAKPIKASVLISRIKALLKHSIGSNSKHSLDFGNLIIDQEKYLVIYNEKKIHLPKKEFDLLSLLASKPDRVFFREEIISKIWDNENMICSRTLDVHVRKIREKISNHIIKTIKGVGYKFENQ